MKNWTIKTWQRGALDPTWETWVTTDACTMPIESLSRGELEGLVVELAARVEAEREECAVIAEERIDAADAIRARGEEEE